MDREELHSSFVRRFSAPDVISYAPVTLDDISRVEGELDITFPVAYLSFITRHGPISTPGILDLVTGGDSEQAPRGASFDVRDFFPPIEIIKTQKLYSEGGMENWLVPIAIDSTGNVFCFKRGTHAPRPDDSPLFLFDHDFCEISQEADSFDAWLESFIALTK